MHRISKLSKDSKIKVKMMLFDVIWTPECENLVQAGPDLAKQASLCD